MRILALDAATEACSVCLWCDGEELGRSHEGGKSSAAQILAMTEECLAEAQLKLSQLDAIAASIGPGAFTGVRISVAVAQGLAFGADLPTVPITTLEALGFQLLQAAPNTGALACLDARMGEVYWGCFAADSVLGLAATQAAAVSSPQTVAVTAEGAYEGVGRGFAAYPELAGLAGVTVCEPFDRSLPNAREMARLAALRFPLGAALDPARLTPLYLRDKVALTTAERAAQSQ
jgi:tRNA threonylcarbamoyladenosine biosynthesis protein TsaB